MRKIPPVIILACVAACTYPETRWDKPGADESAIANDTVACGRAAQQESFRIYPEGFAPPFFGTTRFNRFNNDRVYSESRLTDFCMRSKGYKLVVAGQPTGTQPPAAPQMAPVIEK